MHFGNILRIAHIFNSDWMFFAFSLELLRRMHVLYAICLCGIWLSTNRKLEEQSEVINKDGFETGLSVVCCGFCLFAFSFGFISGFFCASFYLVYGVFDRFFYFWHMPIVIRAGYKKIMLNGKTYPWILSLNYSQNPLLLYFLFPCSYAVNAVFKWIRHLAINQHFLCRA